MVDIAIDCRCDQFTDKHHPDLLCFSMFGLDFWTALLLGLSEQQRKERRQRMGKQKHPLHEAYVVAEELVEKLKENCERIEVMGSIRREASHVGDIELLCIPKIGSTIEVAEDDPYGGVDLFGNPRGGAQGITKNLLDEQVRELLNEGALLSLRPNKDGKTSFGKLNKLLVHVPSGIAVDLFVTTKENWGMSAVIRTGPKEFCRKLMTRFKKLGMKGHPYSGVTGVDGEVIPCPTEEDVFAAADWPVIEPQYRS